MDASKALKYLNKQIEQLEQGKYYFENVVKPRYEQDKLLLEQMREHHVKLQILVEKVKRGEPISTEEYTAAVPSQFR
jgi:uracil-DNA glycosylase